MKSRILILTPLLCLVLFAALSGCAPRTVVQPVEAKYSLGIASIEQPAEYTYLLGSYLPAHSEKATPNELKALDGSITTELKTNTKRSFVPSFGMLPCQNMAKGTVTNSPHAALDYWVNVGKCANVDYLLVPQLLYWKERVGGPAGSDNPASVMIDFFVIDVKEHSIASRYRFEESQVSLSENLLKIGDFFSRGAKWVTATELAKFGINLGLRKVGLL